MAAYSSAKRVGLYAAGASKRVRAAQSSSYAARVSRRRVTRARRAYRAAVRVAPSELQYVDTLNVQATNVRDPTVGSNDDYRIIPFRCGQGSAQNQRDGNIIHCRWIKLVGSLRRVDVDADPTDNLNNMVRIMVVADTSRQSSGGTAPSTGDILQGVSVDSQYVHIFPDRSQVLNNKRFRILADRLFSVGTLATSTAPSGAGTRPQVPVNMYIPLKGMRMSFNATDDSIAYGTNWIYVYIFSDVADSSTCNIQYDLNCRACFVDP